MIIMTGVFFVSKNKKLAILSLVIIVIFFSLLGCTSKINDSQFPVAKEGIIDLTDWDFEENGHLPLDGQWEFYWKELFIPNNFHIDEKDFLEVPSKWNNTLLQNGKASGQGYGTYRLQMKFHEKDLYTEKALFIEKVYSAYKLWIDGELVETKGTVGRNGKESLPFIKYEVIEFVPTKQTTEIVIQVSNFHHDQGGLTKYILLGNEATIDRYMDIRHGMEGFVVGGLALLAVYHFALYILRKEDPSSLYFGLYCSAFAMYFLFNSSYEFIFSSILGWSNGAKLQSIVFYSIPFILLMFVKSFYPKETSKKAVWLSAILFFIFAGITLVTPTEIFTKLEQSYKLLLMGIIGYLFYIFIVALMRKRIGARLILGMFFLFFLTFVHDFFNYYHRFFIGIEISSLGFLLFVGSHSFVLSLRFAKAFRDVEELTEEIETTQREIIYTLGEIAEARSKETGNHVKRVAEYSKILAIKYGLSEKEAELLKLASPMHDIGKVAIPDSILNKPGKLTYEEFEIMKKHTVIGYEMLKHSNREILQHAAEIALTHHERWDGTGYPYGLKGEEIPISGRITAVADVFDALGSDRVYKKAWDLDEIIEYFKEQRGKQFDPILVDIFLENLDDILSIRNKYVDHTLHLVVDSTKEVGATVERS